MSGRVSEHAECAIHEIGEAALLVFLARCLVRIDSQHRSIAAERPVGECRAVVGQSGAVPELLGDAFHRLQYGMKVVVCNEFLATKAKHVGMNAPRRKIGSKLVGATLRRR